jgi:hypothetical protein
VLLSLRVVLSCHSTSMAGVHTGTTRAAAVTTYLPVHWHLGAAAAPPLGRPGGRAAVSFA